MNDKSKNKKKQLFNRIYFLLGSIVLVVGVFLFNPENTLKALKYSARIFLGIIPVLILVIILMASANFFMTRERITRYIGKSSGLRGYSIAAFSGVISHGPIFAWYPLIGELVNEGMNIELAAIFLYTRAIKLPLLPILIYYFGLKFVVVWFLWLIIGSFILGKTTGLFIRLRKS
jgi:uncharacterized membrane protein YraQ (UPF0718 family)